MQLPYPIHTSFATPDSSSAPDPPPHTNSPPDPLPDANSPPTANPSLATTPFSASILFPVQFDSIPDMDKLLSKFGIDSNSLVQVPLKNYRWWNFKLNTSDTRSMHSDNYLPTKEYSNSGHLENITYVENSICTSPTISQRIRSLVRKARHKNHTNKPLAED